MFPNFLLFIYYLMEWAGALMCMTYVLRRVLPLPDAPGWMHPLLVIGIFPVLLSWGGFLGLFRIPFLAPLLGIFFVLCFLRFAVRHAPVQAKQLRRYLSGWIGWVFVVIALLFLALFFYGQHCYLAGGVNNPDQNARSLPMVTAFAANWLKPAYPLDLSIPVSYSYYFHQWGAFLYLSVGGYSWPSIVVLVLGLAAGLLFFTLFPQMMGFLIDRPRREVALASLLFVCATGPDLVFYRSVLERRYGDIDWEGFPHQVLQIANSWHWEFHYMVATLMGWAALISLYFAMRSKLFSYLIVSAAFLFLALCTGAYTGLFYCIVTTLAGLTLIARKQIPWRMVWKAAPYLLAAAVLILLPQIFNFLGREGQLAINPNPLLWFFRNVSVLDTIPADWYEFFYKLVKGVGPLLLLGIAAIPFYLRDVRGDAFKTAVVASMLIGLLFSLTFVRAWAPDWYWRSGQASLLMLGVIGAVWLFGQCRSDTYFRRLAIPAFGVLTLISSGAFFMEHRERARVCSPANPDFMQINRQVDLHTAITGSNVKYTDLSHYSGRLIIVPHEQWEGLGKSMIVYRQRSVTLKSWYDWADDLPSCHKTWFGSSTPSAKTVILKFTDGTFQFHASSCEKN